MKIFTIALTIYNPKIIELENYFYSFRKINEHYSVDNPFQFLIISDNPELSKEITFFIKDNISDIENTQFIETKENLVRVGAVLKNLDKIEGRFVKMADPDDFLIPDKTINFLNECLMSANENSLIINSYRTTNNLITIDNFQEINQNVFYWWNSFNPNSTYPVSILKKIKWDFKLLIWSDDLLGFMLLNQGAKILKAKEHSFYLNNKNNGVSITKNHHNSMSFYNDSMLFFSKVKEIAKNDKKKIRIFNRISSKPNLWMFKQVWIDLDLNTELSLSKKKELFKEFYNSSLKVGHFQINIWVYVKFKTM